jgi:hypothetical protein
VCRHAQNRKTVKLTNAPAMNVMTVATAGGTV